MLQFLTSSIGKKLMMAVSGLVLSGFIIIHALGNSTAYFGRGSYNSYSEHLHALGVLLPVFETILALAFVFHVVTGIILFFENRRAGQHEYAVARLNFSLFLSRTMPYTGVMILIFTVLHYLQLHTWPDEIPPADKVRAILSSVWSASFYLLAVITVLMHIGHGFWSLFQSLGLSHEKYDVFVRRICLTAAAITGAILFGLPIYALIHKSFLL